MVNYNLFKMSIILNLNQLVILGVENQHDIAPFLRAFIILWLPKSPEVEQKASGHDESKYLFTGEWRAHSAVISDVLRWAGENFELRVVFNAYHYFWALFWTFTFDSPRSYRLFTVDFRFLMEEPLEFMRILSSSNIQKF